MIDEKKKLENYASAMAEKFAVGTQSMGSAILFPTSRFSKVAHVREWMNWMEFTRLTARTYAIRIMGSGDRVVAKIENKTYNGTWAVWLELAE